MKVQLTGSHIRSTGVYIPKENKQLQL